METNKIINQFANTPVEIENILKAQAIAIDCLNYMATYLKPGLSRETIDIECARYM